MKKYWNSLSRPVKVAIYLAVILLCVALVLRLLWIAPYNPEKVFRTMETAELIGPSRILAIVDTPNFDYPQLIIAEDGDHVVLCGIGKGIQNHDLLAYRPKQGDVTVYCAPSSRYSSWYFDHYGKEIQIPVVLMDRHPQATRAQIIFTVSYDNHFTKEYVLSASRTAEGVFVFPLHLAPSFLSSIYEHSALQRFSWATGSTNYDSLLLSVPVQVKLFDQTDRVVHEETVTVHSLANQFLAELESQAP